MKPALIDTDILSLFFRGNTNIVAQFQIMITHNKRHFGRVEALELQDWSQA